MREFSRALGAAVLLSTFWIAQTACAADTTAIDHGDVWKTIGLALAAALAVCVSILGAAYAVARIGSAAMGAAAENPELLNRSLLFVALAEGLAVLGFVVAIMIIQKI